MKVIQHERKPLDGHFSIERLFAEIRRQLPAHYHVHASPCPFPSQGLWPRVGNVRHASRQVADVHHIVGDVHYLAFGLPPERTVLTIHDCAALNRLKGLRRAALRYLWFSGPVRRAAVTTTISEASKDELRSWLGRRADAIEVVPNCVSGAFAFAPKHSCTSPPVCLQLGTKWNKNLLRVAAALKGTSCVLEIVGDVAAAQQRELAALGITFRVLGRLSDRELLEAYRRCDFVAFVSLYEGFGLPILEAQATGRPVVTSNTGPMPEAAGEGALFVDPESVDSIRAAVLALVGNPDLQRNLIDKGQENVRKFQPEAIASRYAAIYDRVAGAG